MFVRMHCCLISIHQHPTYLLIFCVAGLALAAFLHFRPVRLVYQVDAPFSSVPQVVYPSTSAKRFHTTKVSVSVVSVDRFLRAKAATAFSAS